MRQRVTQGIDHGRLSSRGFGLRETAWASLLWLAVGITGCDSPAQPEPEPLVPRATDLRTHLEVLAADSLFGRRAGSAHELQAAEYLRDQFQAYGLEPAGSGYQQTFPIPIPVDGRTGLTSQNVIGVLPGAGSLAGQWVIVGAHYDHVGVGEPIDGDSIYNGADDNSSGTALLLELARLLSDRSSSGDGQEARRSLMFQAYGAEEVGLVGSRYFCAQPTVPMDSVVAMLNFDMVGRLSRGGLILIGAASSSDWSRLVAAANVPGLPLIYVNGLAANSDYWCFYQRARPVLFLHTGLHEQYHRPTDEVALIDIDGMVQLGELAAALLLDLALRPERVTVDG